MSKIVSFSVLNGLEGKKKKSRKQTDWNLKGLNKFSFFTKKAVFILKSPYLIDIKWVIR